MKAVIRKVRGSSPGFRSVRVDGEFALAAWRKFNAIDGPYYVDAFGKTYNNAEVIKYEAINKVLARRGER